MAHRGKKKKVAKIHEVDTEINRLIDHFLVQMKNLLIVIRNCPICRNELNDENVMENPAAKVVNAAMNTAEPTRFTDSVTRVTRST